MTMLPVVMSTAQLISGLVSTAKNARELGKDSSDHALKAAVSDLYDSVLNVKERVLDLDEENRRLKQEIAQKEEIEGPSGSFEYFFTKNKPEHPLCPKCLQSQTRNVVFLGPLRKHQGGKLRKCPVCDYGNYEEPPKPLGGAAIAVGSLHSRTGRFV